MQFSGPGDAPRSTYRALRRPGAPVSVAIARGKHLFPFRTEKLSLSAPMVLGPKGPGRVGRRRFLFIQRVAVTGGPLFSVATRAVCRTATPLRLPRCGQSHEGGNRRIPVKDPGPAASPPELAEALGVIRMLAERDRPPAPVLRCREGRGRSPHRLAARSWRGCANRGVPRLLVVRRPVRHAVHGIARRGTASALAPPPRTPCR